MVLHNPNNWHWVNKDVKDWAREYLVKNIVGLSVEEGDNAVKIKQIDTMEGDVDVSQRKGKVITLFDVKLVLDFEGMHPTHKIRSCINEHAQAQRKTTRMSKVQSQSRKLPTILRKMSMSYVPLLSNPSSTSAR